MPPKLHRLIDHVALFAQAWARVGISPGMLSEQGTEHTHGNIGRFDLNPQAHDARRAATSNVCRAAILQLARQERNAPRCK